MNEGEFVFCEDVGKWYLYMGNGNLRLPRARMKELKYYNENKYRKLTPLQKIVKLKMNKSKMEKRQNGI